MTAIRSIRGLRNSFGAPRVTDDVSLDLRAGECHALIGPNSAGKTTLIHQISGLPAPDVGRIVFYRRDVTALDTAARSRAGLGRSFQISAVTPSFGARENVAPAAQAREAASCAPPPARRR